MSSSPSLPYNNITTVSAIPNSMPMALILYPPCWVALEGTTVAIGVEVVLLELEVPLTTAAAITVPVLTAVTRPALVIPPGSVAVVVTISVFVTHPLERLPLPVTVYQPWSLLKPPQPLQGTPPSLHIEEN
jgi:hypothetical protein